MIIVLICFIISKRPALSKKQEKELNRLDNIISEMYKARSREL